MPKNIFASIPQPLLRWYEKNARRLPWRDTPSPYRVLVSEFMLQQTRVEAALSYFDRFISALPDIRIAGRTRTSRLLLKLWEGPRLLQPCAQPSKSGAYDRERNTAEKSPPPMTRSFVSRGSAPIRREPSRPSHLEFTHPAVDGNVLRVVSRLTADQSKCQ